MSVIATTGRTSLDRLGGFSYLAGTVVTVLTTAAKPSTWRRTVRNALGRQVVASGLQATGFVTLVAIVVGILVVVQAQLWLGKVAQSRLLGPVLVTVIIRELGPLLTNFVIIARSGNAIAVELANMKISGEVRALDVQGVDPFIFLVIPRVLGVTISTFCLSVLFVLISLASGYCCARLANVRIGGPIAFSDSIARAINGLDFLNVMIKATLPALLCGVICCVEGLSADDAPGAISRAASRALQRSVAALFLVSVVISVITYG